MGHEHVTDLAFVQPKTIHFNLLCYRVLHRAMSLMPCPSVSHLRNGFCEQKDLAWAAAADRDLLSLSAKTRISQLGSRQIDHRLSNFINIDEY
jgi:hypothetical protein